ncbi:uncharacterized protein LOC110269310 [Arachis ipaensis]|uniref:uncharacterized protein LOC110269310 n=1 Tax=Arachis ipaensis TaxID=130454 RepID=UPI000A2B4BC1|nr:uncharacterized protein LOC110269310 [Arachis ipaensis]XP_025636423.1 uncharacterized protein LOC112730565 [Arachis hypogaea]
MVEGLKEKAEQSYISLFGDHVDLKKELARCREAYLDLEDSIAEGAEEAWRNFKEQVGVIAPDLDISPLDPDKIVVDGAIVSPPRPVSESELKTRGQRIVESPPRSEDAPSSSKAPEKGPDQLAPSSIGEYNHYQCFDYGSMMDPEPNRCRRTDGKKWRGNGVLFPNSITKPCSKLHTSIASNTKSAVSIPTPKVTNFGNRTSVASDNRSSRDLCKKDNQIKNCVGYSISVMSSGKGSVTNDSNCISAGIGFSPRSVLQVSGCNSSHHNYTNSTELEPGRCRRTEGKKWRCKSAVLPGQKYCTTHVHRGAKRRCSTDHEPVTTPTPTSRYANTNSRPIYSAANRTTITEARKTVCTVPNTKLSMSIPASAPLRHNNGKSPNRSSDTDTTITDTINECSYASF